MPDKDALLQWLLDRAKITDVIIAYAASVDQRDWQRWMSLLTEDIELHLGKVGSVTGRAAVGAMAAEALSDITRTHHLICNPDITIEGDAAKARAVLVTLHVVDEADGARHELLGRGFYDFEFARVGDDWKVSSARNEIVQSVGDPGGRAAAGAARRKSPADGPVALGSGPQ